MDGCIAFLTHYDIAILLFLAIPPSLTSFGNLKVYLPAVSGQAVYKKASTGVALALFFNSSP